MYYIYISFCIQPTCFTADVNLQNPVTEADILKCLPDKKTMLMSMVFLTVLSYLDGNPLGDFDYQYLYNTADVKANKV